MGDARTVDPGGKICEFCGGAIVAAWLRRRLTKPVVFAAAGASIFEVENTGERGHVETGSLVGADRRFVLHLGRDQDLL